MRLKKEEKLALIMLKIKAWNSFVEKVGEEWFYSSKEYQKRTPEYKTYQWLIGPKLEPRTA